MVPNCRFCKSVKFAIKIDDGIMRKETRSLIGGIIKEKDLEQVE